MISKDPHEHWNQQASTYASESGHLPFDRFLRLYEDSCWDFIQPVLPKVDSSLILEAGCGSGRWVKRLAPIGYRMVLSDFSSEMIEHARRSVQQAEWSDQIDGFHVLDICDLNTLEDGTFDLVLVLGGPLTLCRDPSLAVSELYRVTKPGGYVICDSANRYRTVLELIQEEKIDQIADLLETGSFQRPDGLNDHRFGPRELSDLFIANGLESLEIAGICPLFGFLPTKEQAGILDDERTYRLMEIIRKTHAMESSVVAISGRLLILAHRSE
jgi:ubiquinone/menaquinone biosynthesis C-methylase UbiE